VGTCPRNRCCGEMKSCAEKSTSEPDGEETPRPTAGTGWCCGWAAFCRPQGGGGIRKSQLGSQHVGTHGIAACALIGGFGRNHRSGTVVAVASTKIHPHPACPDCHNSLDHVFEREACAARPLLLPHAGAPAASPCPPEVPKVLIWRWRSRSRSNKTAWRMPRGRSFAETQTSLPRAAA